MVLSGRRISAIGGKKTGWLGSRFSGPWADQRLNELALIVCQGTKVGGTDPTATIFQRKSFV